MLQIIKFPFETKKLRNQVGERVDIKDVFVVTVKKQKVKIADL